MKNVVIACDYAYIEGGATKVAIQTAIALSMFSNLNVIYLGGSGEPANELLNQKIKVVALRIPDLTGNTNRVSAIISGIYNVKVYKAVTALLKELNPLETIVHIHTWTKVLSSAVFKASADLGVPILLTVHDYFLSCPNGGCYNYVKKCICELKPMSISCIMCNCDSRNYVYKIWRCLRQLKQNKVIRKIDNLRYIFISDFQKKQLEWRMPINPQQGIIKNILPSIRRERIRSENNSLYLFVGRVTQEKGTDLFCEAVTKTRVDAMVIGDGPIKESLKNKYPNIQFTGWLSTDQIAKWRKKARCLIFPSVWYEGSPLTVLEFLMFGIPCIVSDCNAAIDDIMPGINGEIAKAEVNYLCQSINRLKKDEYAKMLSENAYDIFDMVRMDPKIYVSRLLDEYKKCNKRKN